MRSSHMEEEQTYLGHWDQGKAVKKSFMEGVRVGDIWDGFGGMNRGKGWVGINIIIKC